jgi:3-oxoacyl-[acyl-carrier-protein] synthase II
MAQRVLITGFGIISSIGINHRETLASLKAEISGIGDITLLETIHKGKFPLAEVKMTTNDLLAATGNQGSNDLTRTALLGMTAAREAIMSAGVKDMAEFRTGLISANTVGGMDRSELFYQTFLKDD